MRRFITAFVILLLTSGVAKATAKPLERMMKMMDTDGDGVISIDEFNPRREGIVERIDENEDGVVTLDEINQHIAYREAEMAEKIAEMRQRIQQHFDYADTDANGMVTEYEARSTAFNRIDEDGDGYLTEHELRTVSQDMKRHRRHRRGPNGA